jgi:hypothetical protein
MSTGTELGFPLSGPACNRRKGNAVPTARQWRPCNRDQAEATVLRRAAACLREDPGRARDERVSWPDDGSRRSDHPTVGPFPAFPDHGGSNSADTTVNY